MLIRIDPTRDEPVFVQVAASVRSDLVQGRLVPGDRLPAAAQLADSLGINPHTVRHAYQLLREEGLVDMRPGRGAVVTGAASGVSSLRDHIRELVRHAGEVGIPRDVLAGLVRDIDA